MVKIRLKYSDALIKDNNLSNISPNTGDVIEILSLDSNTTDTYTHVDVDTTELKKLAVAGDQKKKSRKHLFSILQKCFNNEISTYFDNISASIFNIESIDFSDWMEQRESNTTSFTVLEQEDVINFGDVYALISSQTVKTGIVKKVITLKGGIILDATYSSWTGYIVKFLLHKKNKTLIICAHKYINIIRAQYQQNNVCIYDIKYILSDTQDVAGITAITASQWERLIIDNKCYQEMLNNEEFKKKIMNIKTVFRWMCLKDISKIKEDIKTYFQYLSGENSIVLPLYEHDTCAHKYPDTIIKDVNYHKVTETVSKIEQSLALIKRDCIELAIDKYFQQSSINLKAITLLNRLIYNAKIKQTEKYYPDECTICLEPMTIDNCIGTKCNHFFCINCYFKIVDMNNKCPFCRIKLDTKTLYRLKQENTILGSKYKHLVSLLQNSKKAILYTANSFMAPYIKDILADYNCFNLTTYKNQSKATTTINEFNNSTASGSSIMILQLDNYNVSSMLKSVDTVIFIDINKNILENKYTDYYTIREPTKVYILIYQ